MRREEKHYNAFSSLCSATLRHYCKWLVLVSLALLFLPLTNKLCFSTYYFMSSLPQSKNA